MTRLLLGQDLSLYEDGTDQVYDVGQAQGDEADGTPAYTTVPSELPYKDARFGGRVLTVAADGTLTWVLNEYVPPVDATAAGAVLTIDDTGSAAWAFVIPTPGGGVSQDEVITTDDLGVGTVYYGLGVPGNPPAGSLWLTTKSTAPIVGPVAPTAAPTLAVPTVSGTTVTITWTTVATAVNYEIRMDGTPLFVTSALTYTFTLPESSTHSFKVAAHNDGGFGPESNARSVTIANQTPPDVTNLHSTATSRGTFSVAWDYTPPADFSAYVVTVDSGTVVVTGKTASVTGLADATNVAITVKARDTGSLTSPGVSITVRTPDAPLPAAPGTPGGLTNTRRGYSSLDYSWNAVAGATSYEVSGDGSGFGSVGTATTFSWTGLAESTGYNLWVRAVNAGGASAATVVGATTLPKVASYTPNYQTRTIGYGNEGWDAIGVQYDSSGVVFTTDGWATGSNSSLYALDLNVNTGPYSTNPGRWIIFSTTLNYDYVYQVFGLWGYPGTFTWTAIGADGYAQQQGNVASNTWGQWAGPNIINSPSGVRIAKIQMAFDAGLGSPGVFKLREWAIQVRQIVSYTTNLNPA